MRRRFLILLIFTVVPIATTWPLATRLNRSIPRGQEASATVPLLNLWTVGWNLDRAVDGWQGYWDAPHFHPTPKTLALSEPLATTQSLLAVKCLPPATAYNLFLLLSLMLNSGVTWLVLRHRRMCWPVAFLASLAMACLPFVHGQIGVLQSVLLAGILGTIHFVDRAMQSGRWRDFLWGAVCFDLTYLTCGYYALFLALLSPIWGGTVLCQHRRSLAELLRQRPRQLFRGIVGAMLVLSAIAPVILVQSHVLSDPFFERRRDLIQEFSALPTDYLKTSFPEGFQFLGLSQWHEPGRPKLSPGVFKTALALLGLVAGACNRRRRAWTLLWFALSAAAFAGSLGLNLRIAGWSPYATLLDCLPTLSRLRTPARLAVLVQIGVVFLAAEALCWGFHRVRRFARTAVRSRVIFAKGLVWLTGLVACFEVPLPDLKLIDVPGLETQRGWIEWLQQNTPRDAVIAHVPFPRGPLARDYEAESWAMYWGLFHQRRMVNGYSGFFPASYLALKSEMQAFPDDRSFAALQSRQVAYLVVRQDFLDERRLMDQPLVPQRCVLAFQDQRAGVGILRLQPANMPNGETR